MSKYSSVSHRVPTRHNTCAVISPVRRLGYALMLVGLSVGTGAYAQPEAVSAPPSSVEQGQTPLEEAFSGRPRRAPAAQAAVEAPSGTKFNLDFRTMYLGRQNYDGSETESLATGGWAGVKTDYFLDHFSFGATGYTSQKLHGDPDKDGALLLGRGQHGYEVLGELYADVKIIEGLNLTVGRKEYDTPFINRNDSRMTPNTFEAISLMGGTKVGSKGASLRYGLGYVDSIKERNSDEFVSMSVDAGAEVERGVIAAGGLYKQGGFSLGALDYYCPDVVNIGFAEAKMEFAMGGGLTPRLAVQFIDQRSVGNDLLLNPGDSGQQYGIKAELPVGRALFTAAYTNISGDIGMMSPWAGYPGYTSVQVEDFNRAGEAAWMLRAAYEFKEIKGLSTYALWVHGSAPDATGKHARDEYNFNLQWSAPEGVFKGLSLRLRYALVDERAAASDDLTDLRLICNYLITF